MSTPEETNESSEWQKSIEGEWYGIPSVFSPEGDHLGHNKVNRSSVFEDGKTTYFMDTNLNVTGPLRSRFEAKNFAFGVIDSDQDRIYMGPDFFGAGQPYGTLVDAHYYSPAWTSDLKTMVHILPDGQTQVYSSLLYDGPTICGVFNGVYKVAHDYESNEDTKTFIDGFVASEKENGSKPHVLPMKEEGTWRGALEVYDANQERVGTNEAVIGYRPISLLRATMDVNLQGVFAKRFKFDRSRNGNKHAFEGPDVFGNGMAYGRALYTSQHFTGEALKIKGREFIIDDNYTMSVVWQVMKSDKPLYTIFGVLEWEPSETVLKARYEK